MNELGFLQCFCCVINLLLFPGLICKVNGTEKEVQHSNELAILDTFDDEIISWGSGEHVLPRSRLYEHDSGCILDVEKADVVFVVDKSIPSVNDKVTNLNDFIMSTVQGFDVGLRKVNVGVLGVVRVSRAASVVVPLEEGISLRAVQDGLENLVRIPPSTDLPTAVMALNKLRSNKTAHRIIVIISSVSFYSEDMREVNRFLKNLENSANFSVYHVVVGDSSRVLGNDIIGEISSDRIVKESSLDSLADSENEMMNLLRKEYGCNVCLPNPCAFAAECLPAGNATLQCMCLPGRIGGICAPCQSNPCQSGRCLVSGSSYVCDPCSPQPCKNGGTCFILNGTADCKCSRGFIGQYCQYECPDCQNGGVCRIAEDQQNAICDCSGSIYTGITCEKNCTLMITCLNGGRCNFDQFDNPVCDCQEPYYGTHCENLCNGNTCRNGGSCAVVEGQGKVCYCTPRYEGEFCETDKCSSYYKCKNGGVCILNVETLQVECKCRVPFSGIDCNISPCFNFPCVHGVCQLSLINKPVCFCEPLYYGAFCNRTSCSSNQCQNGGVCSEISTSEFKCSCLYGYWGKTCSFNPCIPNPCENGGKCIPVAVNGIDVEYTFSCRCLERWLGETCQVLKTTQTTTTTTTTPTIPHDACLSNPCHHPCECVSSCKHTDGYICVGRDGELGKTCSIAPPLLTCGFDAITISIEDELMLELEGGPFGNGYFYLSTNENEEASDECRSIKTRSDVGHAMNRLTIASPFSSCGTRTFVNANEDIVISNKVWFNIDGNEMYDMLAPILVFQCNYTSKYIVSTSINSTVDSTNVELSGSNKRIYSVEFQLCKSISTSCIATCPSHLIVGPGAAYTVGQFINVVFQRPLNSDQLLDIVEFYLSCDSEVRGLSPTIDIITDGCAATAIPTTMSTSDSSICVTFQVHRLRKCAVAYLHAKLAVCSDPLQLCSSGSDATRCPSDKRLKRWLSVRKEDVFGPIFIFPSVTNETYLLNNYTYDGRDVIVAGDEHFYTSKLLVIFYGSGSALVILCSFAVILLYYRKN